ncbi:hypothetical protein Ancab_016981 [Ancistrocladus abbreviatus]
MSYADAVRGGVSAKVRTSDMLGDKNVKYSKATTRIVLSSKEEEWAWLRKCLFGEPFSLEDILDLKHEIDSAGVQGGSPNSSALNPKLLSFVAESANQQNVNKTLFSQGGGSQAGKSDKGSSPVVQAAERGSVTGKELNDPPSGPNSTGCQARHVESVGRSPECLGRSPASFNEGQGYGVREDSPNRQRMILGPTLSPPKAVSNLKSGELGSPADLRIGIARPNERKR